MSSDNETALIAKVKALEDDRVKFLEIVRSKISKLEKELETKTAENNRLVERNTELECSFKDLISLNGKGKKTNNAEEEDLLTRAKELLFEKSKICKKQEQQLEALNNQLVATKDVLEVTKEMLNLRNIESDHLQSRLDSMGLRVRAEKDRFILMEKKLAIAKEKETELTREYENQRNIFKDLRSTYELKINLLTKQLEAAKKSTPTTSDVK